MLVCVVCSLWTCCLGFRVTGYDGVILSAYIEGILLSVSLLSLPASARIESKVKHSPPPSPPPKKSVVLIPFP